MKTPYLPILVIVMLTAAVAPAADNVKSYADPSHVDDDFAIQGEYSGVVRGQSGDKKLGVQVIALGDGKFRAVGYSGGLPSDGWDGGEKEQVESNANEGSVTFEGKYAIGTVKDGVMRIENKSHEPIGDLKRVIRKSPTLGQRPSENGIVLFDGTTTEGWVSARGGAPAAMTADGLLTQGANTKRRFGSHKLHFEFRLPYEPKARGQGRGNSGCYVQGRYEVQLLDSFGLEGRDNECGGIYSVQAPSVNMCFPPLSWQTYDIDFTAAEYDKKRKKTKDARISVKHNGVLILDDVALPKHTPAAQLPEGPGPGFLHLQDHGNPVRYRNIWVEEK